MKFILSVVTFVAASSLLFANDSVSPQTVYAGGHGDPQT